MNESPATASLCSATLKENTTCFLFLRAPDFFGKWKGCFLSWFCLPSIQAVWRGKTRARQSKTIFAGGEGFGKILADFPPVFIPQTPFCEREISRGKANYFPPAK
jgi:hypothetical protein